MLQFCQAAQQLLIVLRDEPTSLTDTYALIKVLSRDRHVNTFRVLVNMTRNGTEAQNVFMRLQRVTDRYLDVALDYAGEIPDDGDVPQAVRAQRSVLSAFPSGPAARAYQRFAREVQRWSMPSQAERAARVFLRATSDAPAGATAGDQMNGVQAYASTAQQPNIDALVRQHADLVKRIAYHLAGRLPPQVEVDDLMQAGMMGLLEAAQNFMAGRGASFETYAGIRIRGAMLDALRKLDWAPRSVHRKARAAATAMREVEARTGREASDADVAAQLGVPLAEYQRHRAGCARLPAAAPQRCRRRRGFNARSPAARRDPIRRVKRSRKRGARPSSTAIKALPERERLVLSLYYEQELNLKEIGAVLKVTESRACQLHGQALVRLKALLTEWRG